jgi:hypothetical protein
MVTRPFDGRELGERVHDHGHPLPELTVLGIRLGSGKDIVHFMRATKSLARRVYVAKRLSQQAMHVVRHGRGMTLTNGNALAGRLATWRNSRERPISLRGRYRGETVANVKSAPLVHPLRLACGLAAHEKCRQIAPSWRDHAMADAASVRFANEKMPRIRFLADHDGYCGRLAGRAAVLRQ